MSEPIRVAQIVGKLMAGGVENVVFNYYRAIDKDKIQFDFYYDADSMAEPPQDLIEMGARFIKIPPYQKLPKYLSALKKHFKENQYIIVHSHLNTLSVFPLYMAWRCKVPVRIAHNHSVPAGENYKRTCLKYFLRFFSKLFPTDYFACSEKAGRWLFGNKTYDMGRVKIVKNALLFEKYRLASSNRDLLREKYNLRDKFVIGHVGRFTFAKNHEFLLDVFKEVLRKNDNARLMLVGDGELKLQIVSRIKELNIEDKVILVGQVNNAENYYCVADVMTLPSLFEGLGLSVIESQAAGTPIIVSEAIPDEAFISNGCTKLPLKKELWAAEILKGKHKNVELDSRSEAFNIQSAVEELTKWYLEKSFWIG